MQLSRRQATTLAVIIGLAAGTVAIALRGGEGASPPPGPADHSTGSGSSSVAAVGSAGSESGSGSSSAPAAVDMRPKTAAFDVGTSGGALGGGGGLTRITHSSSFTGNGSPASQLDLSNTAVTPGSYTYSSFTVDAQGRITAASSGAAPALASTTITAGTMLSGGGDLSANRTISLADIATSTVIGRVAAGTGAPSALTTTQLTTLVNTFTSTLSGAVPASGGGTTTYLRADGTFATPPGTGVTSVATGTGLTGGTITTTGTLSLNINAGSTQTCGAGSAVTALTGVGLTTCSSLATLGAAAGTGTAGVMPVWTNTSGALGNSDITDNTSTHVATVAAQVAVGPLTTTGPLLQSLSESTTGIPNGATFSNTVNVMVMSDSNHTNGVANMRATADANGANLYMLKTRGTTGDAVTTVANGDTLGRIRFGGTDGTSLLIEQARISALVNGTVGTNSMPTDLVFYTTATNSVVEALRLKSDQSGQFANRLGVGTALGTTPVSMLAIASPDAGTALAASTWDNKWTTFGPNVANATGASSGALGLGYSTTSDEAQIVSVAPASGWKPIRMSAFSFALETGGSSSTGIQIANSGAFTALQTAHIVGALTEDSTATFAGASNSNTLVATVSATAQTASPGALVGNNTGTYNTTAGTVNAYGVEGQSTATRSSGANNLTNIGLYGTATGAQVNYSLYADSGDVRLNAISGTTAIGVGNDPTQKLKVDSALTYTIIGTNSPTAGTSGNVAVLGQAQGTYNTTSAGLTTFAVEGVALSTRSSGSNPLTNVGVYADATGAQTNRALWADHGDVLLNGNSGTTQINGASTINNTLTVNGAANASSIVSVVGGAGNTVGAAALSAQNTATFDATGAQRTTYGVFASDTATRSAGANSVVNIALYGSSGSGQTNYAIYTDFGDVDLNHSGGVAILQRDVTLNNTSGTTTIKGATTINNTLTVNGATGLDSLTSNFTQTAQTGNLAAGTLLNTGTFNTTSGALTAYGAFVRSTATRSAGANNLTDVAVYASASGAQVNRALQTDSGDVLLNNVAGNFSAATTGSGTVTLGTSGGTSAITNNGNTTITGGTSGTPLTLADATQATERIRFTGQEYLASAHTDTNGPALLLMVNRSSDRRIALVDSANEALGNTAPQLQFGIDASAAYIDSGSTDATTAKTLNINTRITSPVVIGAAVTMNSTASIGGALNMNSHQITSLSAGVASTDAVNVSQLNAGFVYTTATTFFDDFLSSNAASDNQWNFLNVDSGSEAGGGAGHPGVWNNAVHANGTGSGNASAGFWQGFGTAAKGITLGGGAISSVWELGVPSTANAGVIAGLIGGTIASITVTDGVYCRSNISGTNWEGCTTKASTSTCNAVASSTIPINGTDTFKCDIEVNAGATSVTITVTDVTTATSGSTTITTNIPTAQLGLGTVTTRTSTATNGTSAIDYAYFHQDFTTAR